jgi:malonyl-CoA O-methyltransferase
MHDIGDLMQNINFNDSVVDVESIIIEYKSVLQLQKDLKNIGSKVISSKEKKLGLFSSSKMKQMYSEYEKFRSKEGVLPATYEVIYGSAWKKFNTLKVVD